MATNAAYVLDSYALLAYFQSEEAGTQVLGVIESARDQNTSLYLSLINAGEIYYLMRREKGLEAAERMLRNLRELPIILCEATEERIWNAARLKSAHPLSYADAFAVCLAQELEAILVTGDPEFESVKKLVQIYWLPRKPKHRT